MVLFSSTGDKFYMNDDRIDLIKSGYEAAACKYRKEKDSSLLKLKIFKLWLSLIYTGPILDLGCGSGYPLAPEFFKRNFDYLGVDFSEEQIKLAKHQFPEHTDSFKIHEMYQFCQQSEKNVFTGVVALFSIFHLPREKHYDLLKEVKRISKSGSHFLCSVADQEHQGFEKNWLGAEKMWWSSFSHQWYEKTLIDLGFEEVAKSREKVRFNNAEETNWYLLFRVCD
jgi:SAM-dependent methyltransferase